MSSPLLTGDSPWGEDPALIGLGPNRYPIENLQLWTLNEPTRGLTGIADCCNVDALPIEQQIPGMGQGGGNQIYFEDRIDEIATKIMDKMCYDAANPPMVDPFEGYGPFDPQYGCEDCKCPGEAGGAEEAWLWLVRLLRVE